LDIVPRVVCVLVGEAWPSHRVLRCLISQVNNE